MEKLLTTKDVAEKLRVSVMTVKRLVQKGEIPFSRIGDKCVRFNPDQLERWCKRRQGIQYRLKLR